ncbi:MAG TPA: DUF4234 domain-containing protein [Streptosporangiaceae bacterium]
MTAVPLTGMTAPVGLQRKHRSPLGVWLLSIITFGIYGLVYWYKIHAEPAGSIRASRSARYSG